MHRSMGALALILAGCPGPFFDEPFFGETGFFRDFEDTFDTARSCTPVTVASWPEADEAVHPVSSAEILLSNPDGVPLLWTEATLRQAGQSPTPAQVIATETAAGLRVRVAPEAAMAEGSWALTVGWEPVAESQATLCNQEAAVVFEVKDRSSGGDPYGRWVLSGDGADLDGEALLRVVSQNTDRALTVRIDPDGTVGLGSATWAMGWPARSCDVEDTAVAQQGERWVAGLGDVRFDDPDRPLVLRGAEVSFDADGAPRRGGLRIGGTLDLSELTDADLEVACGITGARGLPCVPCDPAAMRSACVAVDARGLQPTSADGDETASCPGAAE